MANVKISALTSLSTMTDATVVPVVESATTKKITGTSLKQYFNEESIIRVMRSAGGSASSPNWTFTTTTGSATGEWVSDGSVEYPGYGLGSNPYLIFQFIGFTKMPHTVQVLYVSGAQAGQLRSDAFNPIGMSVTKVTSPNVLTAFDPAQHFFYIADGTTLSTERFYRFIA